MPKKENELEFSQIETIKMSAKDMDMIMDMLENPPEPNDALKKMMREAIIANEVSGKE